MDISLILLSVLTGYSMFGGLSLTKTIHSYRKLNIPINSPLRDYFYSIFFWPYIESIYFFNKFIIYLSGLIASQIILQLSINNLSHQDLDKNDIKENDSSSSKR